MIKSLRNPKDDSKGPNELTVSDSDENRTESLETGTLQWSVLWQRSQGNTAGKQRQPTSDSVATAGHPQAGDGARYGAYNLYCN